MVCGRVYLFRLPIFTNNLTVGTSVGSEVFEGDSTICRLDKMILMIDGFNFKTATWFTFITRERSCELQRKKHFDGLVTNTDDITTQSHSFFACSRKKK